MHQSPKTNLTVFQCAILACDYVEEKLHHLLRCPLYNILKPERHNHHGFGNLRDNVKRTLRHQRLAINTDVVPR